MAITFDDSPAAHSSTPRFARLRAVSWRHWFREVAVIAAGALAALAAQAWWQDRQDREREADYVRQLLTDTRENERRLTKEIADDSTAGVAAKRTAAFMFGTGPIPPSDTIVHWLFYNGAFSSSEFQPINGTYAALLTTGDLRLIRDELLRGELVAYAARLDAERENMRFYTQQAFGDAPRVVRAFPFVRGYLAGNTDQVLAEARRFPMARLRSDPDAAGVMFAVQVANTNRLGHLRSLLDATRSLRRGLEM